MFYLNEDEIKRAKMCIANIEDKLKAIKTEVMTTQKPYKSYLKEKLDSITWDVNVLNHMVKEDDEDDN